MLKYEVRKYHELKTREGYAYTFTLYVDGKPACTVENKGDGGATWIDWQVSGATRMWSTVGSRLAPQVLAHVATLPPLTDPKCPPLAMDLELWLGQVAEEFVHERKLKRLCRTNTVFRYADDEPGAWKVLRRPFSPAVAKEIRSKATPVVVEIFNEREAS